MDSIEQLHPLFCALEGHGAARGSALALADNRETRTWAQFAQNVNAIAVWVSAHDVAPGDRCVIVAGNTVRHIELMFGIARAGGIVVPISLLLGGNTMASLMRDAEPKRIFVDQVGRKALGPGALGDRSRICLDIDNPAQGLRGALTRGGLVEPPALPALSDDFSVIYSSGTTGTPKGIVHSHFARVMYALVFGLEYGMNQQTVTYLTTPICSNASWMMILPTLLAGGTLIIAERFDPGTYHEQVRRFAVSHAFLVPTQLVDLYLQTDPGQHRLQPAVIVSAGSPLDVGLKERISGAFNITLFELYGTSEGVGTLLRPWDMRLAADSVGTPIASGEIRIVDGEGNELPEGVVGEIVGRNALVSSGYFRRPDLDRDLTWTDSVGRRFIRSGDLGEIVDGFLYLRGRLKDMLVSGGFNVYPVDIEAALRQCSGVIDAAVVGVPDPRWGEKPFAFVEMERGCSLSADELVSLANSNLNKHQRLSGIEFVNALPRNALGKVVKSELLSKLQPGSTP